MSTKALDQERTTAALMTRSNNGIKQLLVRFENIVALAPTQGKDLNASAVDTYQIEIETVALVRAVEDLLTLTRALKEAWLFGKLDTLDKGGNDDGLQKRMDEDARVVGELLEKLVKARENGSGEKKAVETS